MTQFAGTESTALPAGARCCLPAAAAAHPSGFLVGGTRLWGLGQSQELSSILAGAAAGGWAQAGWGPAGAAWLEKRFFLLARLPILILSFLPAWQWEQP